MSNNAPKGPEEQIKDQNVPWATKMIPKSEERSTFWGKDVTSKQGPIIPNDRIAKANSVPEHQNADEIVLLKVEGLVEEEEEHANQE